MPPKKKNSKEVDSVEKKTKTEDIKRTLPAKKFHHEGKCEKHSLCYQEQTGDPSAVCVVCFKDVCYDCSYKCLAFFCCSIYCHEHVMYDFEKGCSTCPHSITKAREFFKEKETQ